jgi:hypothetical protein
MKIKIISTEVVNKGKWNQVEVTYKNLSTDKIELKNIVSFSNKDVYNTLKDSNKNDIFDVKAEKPRLFTKLAEIAFGQFVSVDKVADTVCLPTILAQQILAIHAQKADLQKNEPAEIVPVPLVTETPRNNLIQFSRK